jgi:Type VI secretion system, TssF
MHPNAQTIYQNILHRASEEWSVDTEDAERDLGQHFDPLVRFLAGACSAELERVYQYLNDTENRLQDRLAKLVLPEYMQYPQPATALATAMPIGDAFTLTESVSLAREADGQKVLFTPVWDTALVPARIVVAVTDDTVIDAPSGNKKLNPVLRRQQGNTNFVSKILLGIEMVAPVSSWKNTTIYFDLRGSSVDESEKLRFFSMLAKAECFLNGKKGAIQSGFPTMNSLIENHLNGVENLYKTIRSRFEQHFITLVHLETEVLNLADNPQQIIENWLKPAMLDASAIQFQLKKITQDVLQKKLIWAELVLPRAIELNDVANRMVVRFNVFPIVNRRLCGVGDGEHHFLKADTLKWLHLQPNEPFYGLRRVFNETTKQHFALKSFAQFKEGKDPTYTVRYGGVGRWDNYNTWQRLAYTLSILQDEYKHHEFIQKAAPALSLEELYKLLDKKMIPQPEEKETLKDIYVILHTGFGSAGHRVRVEYWTSQGTTANDIPPKAILTSINPNIEAEGLELVTQTQGGKQPPTRYEYLDMLRDTLLRRGRIVTKQDIISFCKEWLGQKVLDIKIREGAGIDPRFDYGMSRRLEILLTANPAVTVDDWEADCMQLQYLIEHQSSGNIPFKVIKER